MTLGGLSGEGPRTATLDRPLIVHSHLRWDFVWQRPQQLLSRLASYAPVLFIEEPMFEEARGMATLELSEPSPCVTRAVPHLPGELREQYERSIELVKSLVLAALGPGGALAGRFDAPIQWFYTPMPAPAMLGAFGEVGVVYDCMDELAQFRFAPSAMRERERLLLSEADVVFTGGRRLYESKSRHHANVHFFGCGVDAEHFAAARAESTPVPVELAALRAGTRGIAGYFGVIDERLDYELIDLLAASHPDVAIAMVGPVVKVDPNDLPKRDNIAWLGPRRYEELPACVKGFDVCLMPFALNEATEYINPTKTLEYMAAGRPIVSTAVADVVRNFVPIVRVARSREEFVAAVDRALAEPDAQRIADGIDRARASTWESITQAMRHLMRDAVSAKSRRRESVRGASRDRATRERARDWRRPPLDSVEAGESELTT